MMLSMPENAKVIDLPASSLWFDESGILCSVSKKGPPRTLEETRELIAELRKLVGDRKVCMLIDVTHTSETSREVRTLAAEELPRIVKAIAMVSGSALGKMLANLFFSMKTQPYPVKMFNDEIEAKAWLKEYL